MTTLQPALNRNHARRLREVYRSAGWPWQDVVEVNLLATGLLERVSVSSGHELVRVTQAGMAFIAAALQDNRSAFSAHETLVNRVAQSMIRDGRVVWTSLEVRARLPATPEWSIRWKICKPDVFSIRNSSRQEYLEPIVHEIKVSRADLLGDLKRQDNREAYLDAGGQCWYVFERDSRGQCIADADEVPVTCGVMECADNRLVVLRPAPKRAVRQLSFGVWMALAKATPVQRCSLNEDGVEDQAPLPAIPVLHVTSDRYK